MILGEWQDGIYILRRHLAGTYQYKDTALGDAVVDCDLACLTNLVSRSFAD